jgi:rare lipoprotein A
MEQLTAAHRTYPFDTWVRVRNLTNGKTVDVRIQDRGPFVRGRIIDLSHAGARAIDMIGPGTAKVRLTVIAPPKQLARQPELFAVQVGAFRDAGRAELVRNTMKDRYGNARLVERQGDPPVWRVLVGEEETMEAINRLAERIRSGGDAAFVVRLDEVAR